MKWPSLHRVRSVCRNVSLASLQLFLAACHHTPVSAPTPVGAPANSPAPFQGADSIAFGGVTLAQRGALARGHANDLVVRVEYTLVSRDHALLRLTLEQFSNPESCVPPQDAGSSNFITPAQKEIPITRGTHELEIPITWPGDTGQGADGRVFGTGTLSFSAAMRTAQPDYEFLTRRFGTEFCQRF
jgi:hypothetical protein